MKAVDVLGVGAAGVVGYQESAKTSWYWRGYDGAVSAGVDYIMGSTVRGIGGSPALAAADSLVEVGMKGAGLGTLIGGALQAAPVMVTDPAKFHANSLEGKYGTHFRLASAYGDFIAGQPSSRSGRPTSGVQPSR